MEKFNGLLLGVWREACKHIELPEAAARISELLAQRLPFDLLVVRTVDLGRSVIETLAVAAPADPGQPPDAVRTALRDQDLDALLAWCRRGQVRRVRARAGPSDRAQAGIPDGLPGEALVAPLACRDGPPGLLILACRAGAYSEEHIALTRALIEPFTIALENDRRLRQINAFKEAAEADKRSLLVRLGRRDIADTIIGVDAGLRGVMERVALVAASDVPVLLLGETGSGKEVIARAIHHRSKRSQRPFLRVNCGAIPPELIDSELFGHERGSFTGADNTRQGWFERADTGTLFLDEVGELTPAAQVRLLRVLQDGTFERVGGERTIHSDVRVIAATHRDLQAMVRDGRFRQDLWYRIAVFPVRLPALRDRPEDIPAMATHFALKAAHRLGVPQVAPSPEDLSALLGYSWPGNVRELSSVIERAVILGNGRGLEVSKALGVLPYEGPREANVHPRSTSPARKTPGRTSIPTRPSPDRSASRPNLPDDNPASPAGLEQAMISHIRAALSRTLGRVEGPFGAAKLLQINPHTLRSRMRKLHIDVKEYRALERPPGSSW